MKKIFFVLMSSLFLLVFTPGCKKDNRTNEENRRTNRVTLIQQKTIRLVASHWEKTGDGIFVSSFTEVLSYYRNATTIGVYLVMDNNEIMISQGAAGFRGGKLWSNLAGNDLNLFYRPDYSGMGKPFEQLDIKVVFTE
jgi:hypothetical protein